MLEETLIRALADRIVQQFSDISWGEFIAYLSKFELCNISNGFDEISGVKDVVDSPLFTAISAKWAVNIEANRADLVSSSIEAIVTHNMLNGFFELLPGKYFHMWSKASKAIIDEWNRETRGDTVSTANLIM